MSDYQTAIKVSTIKRLNWRLILGSSLNLFVYNSIKAGLTEEQIRHSIFKQTRDKFNMQPYLFTGFTWLEISKNIKIGVSARCAESKLYGL